ncbi:MAG: hypothetical protein M3419_08375 [Actinomycetota bacterium]|nr:hypothetical protein [Actinomycetota bacterium]
MSRRDDQGSAVVEFVWLGLLLLVPLVYALLTVFEAQAAAYGSDAASRSAGRAFMLSPSQEQAYDRAHAAARLALADHGIAAGQVSVDISCAPDPQRCLSPGSTVSVSVTVQQPLPLVPAALGTNAPSVTMSSTHVEPYGTFREDRS